MNNRRRGWFKNGNQSLPYTPPLDLYTGSAIAIGPRLLRSAYTGPCIRIALSSNTTIQSDINFLSNGYIDEAAILAFVGSGSAIMVTYYDQSGNGNNVSFPLSGPTVSAVVSGTINKVNGKFAPLFTAQASNTTFTSVLAQSVFCVYKNNSLGTVNYILWNSFNNTEGIYTGGTSGGVNGFGIVQGNSIRVQNTIEDTNQNLATYIGDNIDQVRINGSNLATTGALFNDINVNRLGRSGINFTIIGHIQELIIYSTNQNSNRSAIENNINAYYSIY